jgi:hypothetical protein
LTPCTALTAVPSYKNTTAVNISSVKQADVLLKHSVISSDVPAALRERFCDDPSEKFGEAHYEIVI